MMDVDQLTPTIHGIRRMFCCHRSNLSGRFPPNSLDGVRECIEAGIPRIEFDLWFLQDDSMLIFHDYDLGQQTTGTGAVADNTRSSVKHVRYRETDTPLAFLDEIVELASGSETLLQVDLKGLQALGRPRAQMLARALEPVASHTLVGSQAHWNLRYLADAGLKVAFDPMLHFHAAAWSANRDLPPWRLGLHGFWDDAPLAHVEGVALSAYIDSRIDDMLALVPAVEWMVDWRTLFYLQDRGCELGNVLREHGTALAAWTIKDEGPAETTARLGRLFGLGAETIITDAPETLASYTAGI